MTHQAALKTTAAITVATIDHMATIAGCSFAEMMKLLRTDANAHRRFGQYMKVAAASVAKI